MKLKIILMVFTLNIILADDSNDDKWKGKWFPHNPNHPVISSSSSSADSINKYDEASSGGIDNDSDDVADTSLEEQSFHSNCDNGNTNITIDFGPSNVEEMYSCIENKNLFESNMMVSPLRTHNNIPHFYQSSEVCMNETIEYDETIPTFGSYRPLWAKYGEYIYLPVQRWMHNIKNGAIVMLYHPCANQLQTEKLKNIVKSCLFRHIITPSVRLSRERPMALVAWSKSLEFSVANEDLIKDFIKKEALNAPENISKNGKYKEHLMKPAQIVTNQSDMKLCPE